MISSYFGVVIIFLFISSTDMTLNKIGLKEQTKQNNPRTSNESYKTNQVIPKHNYSCIRNLGRRILNDPGNNLGKLHGQRF